MDIDKIIMTVLKGTTALSLIGSIVCTAIFVPVNINYRQTFKQPIEFAVSDTSIEKAADRFDSAAKYLERHELHDQDICVFVYSPICDTSEFHRKLLETTAELRNATDLSIADRARVQSTIRDRFVTHTSEGGERIGIPEGIVRTIIGSSKTFGWMFGAVRWGAYGLLLFCVVVWLGIWQDN